MFYLILKEKEIIMYLIIFLYFSTLIFMAFIKESKVFLVILIISVLITMYLKIAQVSVLDVANYLSSFEMGGKPVEEAPRTADVPWD
ncbi:MAG: hypothetical protein K8S27_05305 [Candidatus Omnitrophica bacterium]|nr:hypothetical protein [Candidatus Omnitrophota bacterium]